MPRRTLAGSRAIVTGASSGIGRELALELARHAVDVVIVARSATGLEEVAAASKELPGRVEPLAGDITLPEVRVAAIHRATSAFGGLDILVNNAGVGAIGRFEHADPQRLIFQSRQPFLHKTLLPLVAGLASNPKTAAQVAETLHAHQGTQCKLCPLVHDFRLRPRHTLALLSELHSALARHLCPEPNLLPMS